MIYENDDFVDEWLEGVELLNTVDDTASEASLSGREVRELLVAHMQIVNP